MAKLPNNWVDEIAKSRTAGGGTWLQHGDYTLMITKWYFQQIQDACVITEFVVVESKKKTVFEGEKAVTVEPNAVASEVSEVANFDGPGKLSAKANVRAIVLGLFGYKEGDVADGIIANTMREVVDDNTPVAGMLIRVSTYAKEKRSAKGEYITGRAWDCVAKPGAGVNAPELVKARLAALANGNDEAARIALDHLHAARSATAAAIGGAAPTATAAPAVAPPPPVPAVSSPWLVGWTLHPTAPGYYYRGQEVKTEADLKAAFGA